MKRWKLRWIDAKGEERMIVLEDQFTVSKLHSAIEASPRSKVLEYSEITS